MAQICPKRKLGFKIQKTNVGIRISMLEIPCVPIFRQNRQLFVFGPKFAQKWILGSKFQKSKSGFGISILEILCAPIFRQNGQLWIFGPKFAQKWILGSEFQKSKSGFRISTSNITCANFQSKWTTFNFSKFTKNEKLKKELKIFTYSCTIEFKYILIKTASEFSYKPVQKVI